MSTSLDWVQGALTGQKPAVAPPLLRRVDLMKQIVRVPPQFFRVGFMLCGQWSRESGSSKDTSEDLKSSLVANYSYYLNLGERGP